MLKYIKHIVYELMSLNEHVSTYYDLYLDTPPQSLMHWTMRILKENSLVGMLRQNVMSGCHKLLEEASYCGITL